MGLTCTGLKDGLWRRERWAAYGGRDPFTAYCKGPGKGQRSLCKMVGEQLGIPKASLALKSRAAGTPHPQTQLCLGFPG